MDFLTQLWIFLLVLSIVEIAVINSNQNVPSHLIPCKVGWFLFGNMCYKVLDKTKALTWKQAGLSCAVNHGSLVKINSQELQDFLTTFLLLDVKSSMWIGLHDTESESNFRWEDKSALSYTNWNRGEPSRGFYDDEQDCVEMLYSPNGRMGAWNDIACEEIRPFVCQSSISDQSLNHDPRFCTDENEGAWKYMNSCYHTVDREMTWDDAEHYCKTTLEGHLLSVHDSRAELFLQHVLKNFSEEFWIGIKIREDTHQIWSSGWLVKFKKWESSHKQNVNGTCAYMTKERVWSTAPCFRKLPFVCEVPNGKLPALKQAPKGWRCPELSKDWIDLGGDTCYIFETSKRQKWHEANFFCLKKGGHLASLHSVAETIAIHPHVISTDERMFIGLHRSLINNSVFEWVDGTAFNYQNWAVGEPNDKNEFCGEIWTDDMVWNDVPCNNAKGYICSAKKVPPTTLDENESTFLESQRLEEMYCSGNVSSKTMLVAILFFSMTVLLIAGFAIYNYKDHCRKSKNKSEGFSLLFTPKDQAK